MDILLLLRKFYNKGFTRSIFNYKYNFTPTQFDKLFDTINKNTINKFPDIIEIIRIDNYYSNGYINPNKIPGSYHKYNTDNLILIDNTNKEEPYINSILLDYLLNRKNYISRYLNKINKKERPIIRESKLSSNKETEYIIINCERIEKTIKITDINNKNIITTKKLVEKKNISLKIYIKGCEYRFLGHVIFSNNIIIIKTDTCIINLF